MAGLRAPLMAAAAAALVFAAPAQALLPGGNLIVNGDAESGPAAMDTDVARPLPGWEVFSNITAVKYNQGSFPVEDGADPVGRGGTAFFSGGPGGVSSSMTQTLYLDSASVAAIADGDVTATLEGDFGGHLTAPDRAMITASFGTGPEDIPTVLTAGPVTAADRNGQTELQHRSASTLLPATTTYVRFEVAFTAGNGGYVKGYADNLRLTLSAPLDTEITGGPDSVTSDTTPTFTYRAAPAAGSTFLCGIDVMVPTEPCDAAGYTSPPLPDGLHTFVVAAQNGLETDTTPATRQFTVAATPPPTTTITGGPGGPTNDATPAFTFTSDAAGATFDCAMDGGAPAACTSGADLAALPDGEHTFTVHATSPDAVRDPVGASRTFQVDTKAPATVIALDPASGVSTVAITIQVQPGDPTPSTGIGALRCVLDPATPPATFGDLPAGDCPWRPGQAGPDVRGAGTHVLYAAARDNAGNVESPVVSRTFRITPQRATVITGGPAGPTNDNTPAFTFALAPDDPAATFACAVDAATPAPCASGGAVAALPDGSHTIKVTGASDGVAATPATRAFVVDTKAPVTTIGLPPSALITGSTRFTGAARITVEAADSGSGIESTRCALDAPAATFDALPAGPCPFLGAGQDVSAPGAHVVYAASRDAAGNAESPVVQKGFTVITAVDTRIIDKPPTKDYARTARFTFDATIPGSSFDCRVDGGAYVIGCATPFTTGTLAAGPHTFAVRAVSPDGDVDLTPATWTWTVGEPQTTVSTCTLSIPFSADPKNRFYHCDMQLLSCPPGARCTYTPDLLMQTGDGPEVRYYGGIEPWPTAWLGGSEPECSALPEDNLQRHHCTFASFTDLGEARLPGAAGANDTCTSIYANRIQLVKRPCNRHNLTPGCWAEGFRTGTPGLDSQRFLICEVTMKVDLAPPLAAAVLGERVVLAAPGAGVLQVLAGTFASRSAAIARAAVRPSRQTVSAAGPVTLKLRLSPDARRRLRARRRLALTLRVRFTAADGTVINRRLAVKLRRGGGPG